MTACDCNACQSACGTKPGWFMPGEAEKAAELLVQPFADFFAANIGVDWYENDGEDTIFLLSPAIKGMQPGGEFPGDPNGVCVFFEQGRCKIHAAKPFECREYLHNDNYQIVSERHETVALAWKDKQEQITELLCREPIEEDYFPVQQFGIFL